MVTATPTDIPSIPGANDLASGSKASDVVPIFVGGKPPMRLTSISDLKAVMGNIAPNVSVLAQTGIAYTAFTDGGAAVGTLAMTGSIPAGAIILGTKVLVSAGFAGNVSATLTIGDGSDVDRYMTGTPSVFATAASGIETGVPSGNKLLTAANSPTLTVTASADFTAVNAGSMDVYIYYIETTDQ